MDIAEDVKADDSVAALAGELAQKTGYISLDSPDKITRGWFLRMARAILAERERAAKVCEAQAKTFLSPEYATGQPLSSFSERFACDRCASAIRSGER